MSTIVVPKLTPHCDVALVVTLKKMNASGVLVPFDSGTVDVFIANSLSSTSTAAAPTLIGSAAFIAGSTGKWTVTLDADVILPAVVAPLFADLVNPPYLVVWAHGAQRLNILMEYQDAKVTEVTT